MHETTSATATFLFTDIEGSTELLKAHRAEYANLLAEHHRILRDAFAAYGGTEVDNQGDSFFVAFTRAKDAVLAAAAAQRALAAHAWPGDASVRVRMGIHTGEAARASERYVGLSVHRAARISAIAYGGQVLVSPTTASLLEDDDELPGVALKDIGEYRLKDIARPVRLHQLEIDGLPQTFPRLRSTGDAKPNRRKRVAAAAGVVLVAAAAAVAIAATRGNDAPPRVVANSLVRIDPETLEPTDVVPIPAASDLIVSAGGFLWITHHLLRDTDDGGVRNAGDRTLTRVDPATGDVVTVGGGLAPCGLTADPSGDVWVANCFVGEGPAANVVRVDAKTLRFEATWRVPGGSGIYRGLTYGGGSLWVSDDPDGPPVVAQVDPQTGRRKPIRIANAPGPLAWSGGYGDLWVSNFGFGELTKVHASTGAVQTIDSAFEAPAVILVDGDTVWVANWSGPLVERLSAVGPGERRMISLPVRNPEAGVWSLAAGEGYVWAVTPRSRALWRIDPKTNAVTRIRLPRGPTGVATSAGAVWVTVRR